MTARQPRNTQLSCDECGYTTARTTARIAAAALARHSCATQRKRAQHTANRIAREQASGPERPCTHDGRHEHGTRARYAFDRCRCRPCRDANTAYANKRDRDVVYGRPRTIDAEPARTHVRDLMARGMGRRQIIDAAGVPASLVVQLLYGKPGRLPSRRITPANAEKLLAVRYRPAAHAVVDGTGTARRVQALHTLGWSVAKIAERAGLDRARLDRTLHGGDTLVETRDAVAAAYDALWATPAPTGTKWERIAASAARNTATRNRWAPPLAWDDDTIDNPEATPDLGEPAGRAKFEVEDIEWVLQNDPVATAEQVAHRLGVTKDAIQQRLSPEREDRPDLLATLARNIRLTREGAA